MLLDGVVGIILRFGRRAGRMIGARWAGPIAFLAAALVARSPGRRAIGEGWTIGTAAAAKLSLAGRRAVGTPSAKAWAIGRTARRAGAMSSHELGEPGELVATE
jgi:hypothetical protein